MATTDTTTASTDTTASSTTTSSSTDTTAASNTTTGTSDTTSTTTASTDTSATAPTTTDTTATAPATDSTSAAPTTAAPAPAPQPAASVQTTQFSIDDVIAKVGVVPQMALKNLVAYISAMAPKKPVSVEEGARQQVILYRALTTLINKSGDDFDTVFPALLKLFDLNKDGVFAETHAFRFFEHIPLAENDRKGLQRLLNLLKLLAPIKGRELALRQVDFSKSLQYGIDDAGRNRVLAFFGK